MNKEKLVQLYLKNGYSLEEIEKILEGKKDIEDGNIYSAEDIYKQFVIKDKTYA